MAAQGRPEGGVEVTRKTKSQNGPATAGPPAAPQLDDVAGAALGAMTAYSRARAAVGRVTKTSVALDERTIAALDARASGHQDRSAMIRTLIGWYEEIVRRERPALEEAEWNAIRDALNGTALLLDAAGVGLMAAGLPVELADACRLNGLAAKWGIDGEALVRRLDALTFAGRLAVIDDVLRFWCEVERGARATSGPSENQ